MKTHEERMHELLYDCEGIVEKSERICKLEEENNELRKLAAKLINAARNDARQMSLHEWEEIEGMAYVLGIKDES